MKYLKSNDILNYIEKLFDNIKLDETHNSVIQSIMLIKKLINNKDDKKENIFDLLDKKYQIFTVKHSIIQP